MSSSKSSANVFGSFLNAVKGSEAKQSVDPSDWMSSVSGVEPLAPAVKPVPVAPASDQAMQGSDVLTLVVKSLGAENEALTIVDLSKRLARPLDVLAATLRDGVSTGLIEAEKRVGDGAVAYRATPLGRQIL